MTGICVGLDFVGEGDKVSIVTVMALVFVTIGIRGCLEGTRISQINPPHAHSERVVRARNKIFHFESFGGMDS